MIEFENAPSLPDANVTILQRAYAGWTVLVVYPEVVEGKLTGFYWMVFRRDVPVEREQV